MKNIVETQDLSKFLEKNGKVKLVCLTHKQYRIDNWCNNLFFFNKESIENYDILIVYDDSKIPNIIKRDGFYYTSRSEILSTDIFKNFKLNIINKIIKIIPVYFKLYLCYYFTNILDTFFYCDDDVLVLNDVNKYIGSKSFLTYRSKTDIEIVNNFIKKTSMEDFFLFYSSSFLKFSLNKEKIKIFKEVIERISNSKELIYYLLNTNFDKYHNNDFYIKKFEEEFLIKILTSSENCSNYLINDGIYQFIDDDLDYTKVKLEKNTVLFNLSGELSCNKDYVDFVNTQLQCLKID